MSGHIELLKGRAFELRMKANHGVIAVAAARDLAAVIPTELRAMLDKELMSGALKGRWDKALADARTSLPNAEDEQEVQLAALLDVLNQFVAQVARTARAYADKIEGDRRATEGRALGIEEAVAGLPPPDPPPAESE